MRYKENWEMSKKRLTAYWNQEIIDRCCFSVKVFDPHADRTPLLLPQDDAGRLTFWTDPEAIIRRSRYRMEHTYYGADAFPALFVNLGAAGHAGFFKGARYQFADSVWFFPALSDPSELEFDENSYLFRRTIDLAKAFAEDSRGDYMVSMPDSTGNADALSHLLGPEEMLPLMLDEDEKENVKEALNKLETAYERVMSDMYRIVRGVNEGGSVVDWMGTWAPGLHAQMQCDMSVMISNSMFKDFILPELQAQSRFLDYSIYHLDGMEQIRHLDDLLAIPELHAIQWTQVAGQPPCTDYIPELKRIQAAGKSILIGVSPDQIRPIMENLSSKGLLLCASADSREEADAMTREVERLTHD